MKKLSFLLFLFFVSKVYGQNTVLLKAKYLPNHKYTSVMTLDTRTEMNVEGDSTTIATIKAKGIKLPLIISGTSEIKTEFQTGSPDKNANTPVIITFTNISSTQTMNDEEKKSDESPLLNTKIYSHAGPDGKMQLDSIPGNSLNEKDKNTLISMIKNLQGQFKFTEAPIKIGDSFTQDVSMTVPIEGNNMPVTLKLVYKLVDIKNNKAYFNIDENANLEMTLDQGTINMLGKGEGKMIFDVSNSIALSYNTDMTFTYNMKMGNMTINGMVKTISTHINNIN